jgi:hypothetical protein
MSSLSSIYIKKETLETLLKTLESKGEKGISIDISIGDETNDFGQNVSSYVSQTKEQREAKKKRYYIGNGKCFWTNGTIVVAEKKEPVPDTTAPDTENDDLPF